MTKLVSVDLETTGLDPLRHEIWDVGLVVFDSEDSTPEEEYQWFLPVTLATAEPMALTVGKFYERHPLFQTNRKVDQWGDAIPWSEAVSGYDNGETVNPDWAAHRIARLTDGAHLVGNVVSFDAAFLNTFMRKNGAAPSWHYHLIDVEAMVAGAIGMPPPWKSRELSEAIGVAPPTEKEAHSALTDARWSKDLYWAAMQRYAAMGRESVVMETRA